MRKIVFIIAGILGALLALAAAILLLVDVNQFREPIRAQVEQRLKRPITIGQLGLKLIPLSIRLDDVAVGESPKFPSRAPFLAAKQMYVRVDLMSLLKKQINVESVRVEQPLVELIRNAEGQWNASSLGESSSEPSSSGGSSKVEINDLRIEDGRVAITDLKQKRPRAVYDHIDIAVRDFSAGKKFKLEAKVHLPGKGTETVTAHVTGDTPLGSKTLLSSDLDGGVTLEAVSLTGLQAFTGSTPNQAAKAVFDGKLDFQNRSGVLTGKGNLDIAEPRLKTPARIEFNLREESESGALTLSAVKLALGSLATSGNATIQTKATPSTVVADFRADNAALGDVLRLASAFSGSEGIDGTGVLSAAAHVSGPVDAVVYNASGTLRDARITLDSLRKPVEIQSVAFKASKDQAALENIVAGLGSSHLRGNINVRDFSHPDLQFTADIDRLDTAELEQLQAPSKDKKSGGSAAHPLNGSGTISVGTIQYNQLALTDVRGTCKLENGIIRLDPLTAKLFGGEQAGSIAVDTRTQQTAFNVRSKVQNVDANKLLSSTTAIGKMLSGLLSGDIDVRANPQPGQELARALNGTVKVQLTNGKLAGVHLLNEIAKLAKFLGYNASNAGFTNIIKLAGTLTIQNGVANTDDLQLQFDGGTLGASGSVGLADQQVKMRVMAVLPKEVSQRAGGNRIGGFMSTVLANSKGELVIPALVTGTFDKLRFAPDPERMAKMKLDGLIPTRDNPLAPASKIQGIWDALTAKPGGPTPAGQQPQKKKGILDIIDSIQKNSGQK